MAISSLELKANDDNIKSTFLSNELGRNQDVFDLLELLCNVDNNINTIALNGAWGSGKTFLIKQTINILKEVHTDKDIFMNKADSSLQDKLTAKLFLPVYYDAWENDNDTDPMLSIVFSIMQQLETKEGLSNHSFNWRNLIGQLSSKFTSINVAELKESDDILAEIKQTKGIHNTISEFLSEIYLERGNQLVIFIDELDRCKPDFAIKLLERIKHYFEIENVLIVFSVNLSELRHSVSNVYGTDFSAQRYLDRFFDYKIQVPTIDKSELVKLVENPKDNNAWIKYIKTHCINYFGMELRDINKFLIKIDPISERAIRHDPFALIGDFALKTIFLPIAFALQITDPHGYSKFVTGDNFEVVKKFYESIPDRGRILEVSKVIKAADEPQWEALLGMVYADITSGGNKETGKYYTNGIIDNPEEVFKKLLKSY